jgi:hypothetical protein
MNDSPTGALPITDIPFMLTQDVRDFPINSAPLASCAGGTSCRYSWFKYTTGSSPVGIAAMIQCSAPTVSSVFIVINMWSGDTPVSIVPAGRCEHANGSRGVWLWIQRTLSANTTYYFQLGVQVPAIFSDTIPMTLSILAGAQQYAPTGSLMIPNDEPNNPALIISNTTGGTLRNQVSNATEFGTALPSGEIALALDNNGPGVDVFDQNMNLLGTVAIPSGASIGYVSSDRNSTFYYAYRDSLSAWHATTVSKAGVAGATTWDLPSAASMLCPNRGGTILYYTSAGANQVIKRFDLVNNVALSNLAAGIANRDAKDIFVGNDDTIYVGYDYDTPPGVALIRRYNPDGTTNRDYSPLTIATIPAFAFDSNLLNHMAIDPDELSFWVWNFFGSKPTFRRYRMNDGALLATVTYGETADQGSTTPFPLSSSCPLIILNQPMGVAPPVPPTPPAPSGCNPSILRG